MGFSRLLMSLVTSVFDNSNSMYAGRTVYEVAGRRRRKRRIGAFCVIDTVGDHQSLPCLCCLTARQLFGYRQWTGSGETQRGGQFGPVRSNSFRLQSMSPLWAQENNKPLTWMLEGGVQGQGSIAPN